MLYNQRFCCPKALLRSKDEFWYLINGEIKYVNVCASTSTYTCGARCVFWNVECWTACVHVKEFVTKFSTVSLTFSICQVIHCCKVIIALFQKYKHVFSLKSYRIFFTSICWDYAQCRIHDTIHIKLVNGGFI